MSTSSGFKPWGRGKGANYFILLHKVTQAFAKLFFLTGSRKKGVQKVVQKGVQMGFQKGIQMGVQMGFHKGWGSQGHSMFCTNPFLSRSSLVQAVHNDCKFIIVSLQR